MVPRGSESRNGKKNHSPSDRENSQRQEIDTESLKGLCLNCANRETCKFQRSEGGVWHCQEYVEER